VSTCLNKNKELFASALSVG